MHMDTGIQLPQGVLGTGEQNKSPRAGRTMEPWGKLNKERMSTIILDEWLDDHVVLESVCKGNRKTNIKTL